MSPAGLAINRQSPVRNRKWPFHCFRSGLAPLTFGQCDNLRKSSTMRDRTVKGSRRKSASASAVILTSID
jgi:hypothetical protein